jgi:hypothetical protein
MDYGTRGFVGLFTRTTEYILQKCLFGRQEKKQEARQSLLLHEPIIGYVERTTISVFEHATIAIQLAMLVVAVYQLRKTGKG